MKDSGEFDYGSKADTKDVMTKSGPVGLLVVFYIAVSLLGIIALLVWWLR